MKILGIETSCDDTGIAVLETSDKGQETRFKVLSNVVSSQIEIHRQYGGVFPMMARREHQKNLVSVLKQALGTAKMLSKRPRPKYQKAKLGTLKNILEKEQELYEVLVLFLKTYEKPAVDFIAVTHGPGLEPCLWVGVNFSRALSYYWDIPIIPVNHIEAHILVNLLEKRRIVFPAIALVVSGGHTQLILVRGIGKYQIIGETRDDAAGECFDKAAKLLGLGYPGGPIIAKMATNVSQSSIALPRPMINTKDYDFSFSGLKTAVLYKVRDKRQETRDKNFIRQMCFETQQAILDVLIKKTIRAAKDYKVKTIILGGGVSANKELRKQLGNTLQKEMPLVDYVIPDAKLSTDNGLMIAIAGYFNRKKKVSWQKLKANANLRISK